MRIRKRRAQEVDHSSFHPSSSSPATPKHKDENDMVEIGSERFELATRSGGEAAALSLVLLAAEAVPHAAQVYKTRQDYYREDPEVLSGNQFYKVDSASIKEKLDTLSNPKAGSRQLTSGKGWKLQRAIKDSSSIHQTGSYTTPSSEGELPAVEAREDEEISTRSSLEFQEGIVRDGKFQFTRSSDRIDIERYEIISDSKGEIQRSRESKQCIEAGYGLVSSSTKLVPSKSRKEVTRALEPTSEVANVGTRCTRVDGRSWQCRRTSFPGFSLCEHHHLQLSNQSRRQRNFSRAFNQSSKKRMRKEKKPDMKKGEPQEADRISQMESSRRKVVKARSLKAIVRSTVDVGTANSSLSIS